MLYLIVSIYINYVALHSFSFIPDMIRSCFQSSPPHILKSLPASIRLPKNFQPVGTSNISLPLAAATLMNRTCPKPISAYKNTIFY